MLCESVFKDASAIIVASRETCLNLIDLIVDTPATRFGVASLKSGNPLRALYIEPPSREKTLA